VVAFCISWSWKCPLSIVCTKHHWNNFLGCSTKPSKGTRVVLCAICAHNREEKIFSEANLNLKIFLLKLPRLNWLLCKWL